MTEPRTDSTIPSSAEDTSAAAGSGAATTGCFQASRIHRLTSTLTMISTKLSSKGLCAYSNLTVRADYQKVYGIFFLTKVVFFYFFCYHLR